MKDKHVLITGHTGFKGSWLIAMLHHQGAKVSGIALDPTEGGIFTKASLHELLAHDLRLDIRDSVALTKAFQKISPDVVIHLAAQPIVLASYEKPSETYAINVSGTLNVLMAVEATSSVEATLVITTDKVYRQYPLERRAFVESDALGAADPYSTSKAMADLLTQSWIASHPQSNVAIARAGNVIGGGDVAPNRLLPDLVKSFARNEKALIRNPQAVRPWQHVLDCLTGYSYLVQEQLSRPLESAVFNFGPDSVNPLQVREVAAIASESWGGSAEWEAQQIDQPHESEFLALDSSKAKAILGWREKLPSRDSVQWAVEWETRVSEGEDARFVTMEQLQRYLSI